MTVRELFARLRGQEVAVLPNPGNCGDGLIWLGLRELCREHDLQVVELDERYPAHGEVLLVPAAGNLCGAYHSMTDLLARYLETFREIYILPCSVDVGDPEVERFLRSLPAHVHLFAREKYSYAQARFAIGDASRVHLDHDLAFSLDYARWNAAGEGTLHAFRGDLESRGNAIPDEHVAVVHSDRAHVSICAALLGKETHVYPNAYHKVRGIYEHSLRAMPNVHFHGFDEIYAEAAR